MNLLLNTSVQIQQSGYFSTVIIAAIMYVFSVIKKKQETYVPEYESRFNFKKELLLITAYILRIDGDVKQQELKFVYWFLEREYGSRGLKRCKKSLHFFLQKNYKIDKTLKKIEYNQDITTKIQFLNYLVKIATIDGYLSNSEFKALTIICKKISLSIVQLKSILALHSFITEKEQEQKRYKKTTNYTSQTKLSSAYLILGIEKNTSVAEIKKAYRKLVLIYHPDKIMHLNKEFKIEAKDKFQKVNDAYDLLKNRLNFK